MVMKTRLWGYDAEKEVKYIARILKDNNAIVIKDDGTIDYEETADNLISDCDLYRGSVLTALVLEDIYNSFYSYYDSLRHSNSPLDKGAVYGVKRAVEAFKQTLDLNRAVLTLYDIVHKKDWEEKEDEEI